MRNGEKKPIWKNWSCLGLVIVLLMAIGVIGCSSQSTQTTTPNKAQTDTNGKNTTVSKTPDPITLTGSGQQATSKFSLEKGLSVFKMTHNGGSNFAPILLDKDGNMVELLANEIGSFNGSKAVGIKNKGEYLLDISASGDWTITIQQTRLSDAPSTTSFSGTGQQVTELFNLSKGLKVFKMTHNGGSNFAPILLDKDGNMIELLANEIGSFNGSKAVKINTDGIYILDVAADGSWTITIQ